jgi:plasmid maintenance system antidote protein VapI
LPALGEKGARKGETLLAKWIDARKPFWTRKKVARELGLSLGHIHRLCRQKHQIGLETALKIEKLTGGEIPTSYWVTP